MKAGPVLDSLLTCITTDLPVVGWSVMPPSVRAPPFPCYTLAVSVLRYSLQKRGRDEPIVRPKVIRAVSWSWVTLAVCELYSTEPIQTLTFRCSGVVE